MSNSTPSGQGSLGRDTRLLIAASGLFAFPFYGIQMVLRVLYVLRLGHGPAYVGLFGSVGAFVYMTMGLPSGALGRRFGIRRTMIVGGVITTVGMALLPVTEFLPASMQGAWPIASQMIRTAGWSMFNVNLIPALTAATAAAQRSQAYALNGMLKGLGTFVGTVLGGLLPALFARLLAQNLDAPRPYGVALWAGAALSVAALVPLLRVSELERQAAQEQTEAQGPFPVLAVALLVLHVYLSHGGWAIRQAFASAYMDTVLLLPAVAIGLITGVGQFASVLTPLLNPRLSRRWGDGWTLMVTALGIGLSLLPMALVPHWSAVAVGSIGVLSMSAMWMPALHVFQMERVEPRWRSLAYGAASMAMGLSFGTVSLVGGYIAAARGYRVVFALGVGISIAGAVLMKAILQRNSMYASRHSERSEESLGAAKNL
jgi:MFS family permease